MKSSAFIRERKVVTKTVIASTLGFALLLGGSTYALWSATGTANSSSTISTGDLKVTAASTQNWFNITDSANPVEISDLSNFRLSPGQTLQLKQDLNVVVIGDNMTGILKVVIPNDTLSLPLMSQAVFTLTLLDKDGVELGSVTPTSNTSNSLSLETPWLSRTTSAGEKYTVELSIALPTSADDTTKNQTANLGDMGITLSQGSGTIPDNFGPVRFASAAIEPTPAQLGVLYNLTVVAKGAGPITLTATGLPSGLSMSTDGVISGKASAPIGDYPVQVTAHGPKGNAVETFTITVVGTTILDYQNGGGGITYGVGVLQPGTYKLTGIFTINPLYPAPRSLTMSIGPSTGGNYYTNTVGIGGVIANSQQMAGTFVIGTPTAVSLKMTTTPLISLDSHYVLTKIA